MVPAPGTSADAPSAVLKTLSPDVLILDQVALDTSYFRVLSAGGFAAGLSDASPPYAYKLDPSEDVHRAPNERAGGFRLPECGITRNAGDPAGQSCERSNASKSLVHVFCVWPGLVRYCPPKR